MTRRGTLKKSMRASANTDGWLYVLEHNLWLPWRKVGRTSCPTRRLRQYQTGDPHRAYQMVFKMRTSDCSEAEMRLIARLTKQGYVPHGEWFDAPLSTIIETMEKLGLEGSNC